MYALFEEAGKFFAGRVMSETQSSVQVELDSGKRVKVKAANVLLRFDQPAPAQLLGAAQAIARDIDLDLAWEFAPEHDFSFADLARDYFDASAGTEQQAAALLALFDAPHYFRRIGRGQFRKAPPEIVKAALLGIARKQAVATQIDAWAGELAAGACPAPVRDVLYRILFKPDKNAPEYKAVVEASRRTQKAPLELLKAAGAIDSPYQFHWKRFLFESFPRGTALPALDAPPIREPLPLAEVRAFSIDDSATTEIDDAISVAGLGSGVVTLGIHIAAPGLAFAPDSALDQIARERLSTVYVPGFKLTMLPDTIVQAFTLVEGRDCPAVSLYLSFDEATLEARGSTTRLERVHVACNLRHDQLDDVITEASLSGETSADYAFAAELGFAFRLARHLKAQRELQRGKPETFSRPDYTFRLDGDAQGEPRGDERVTIAMRPRGTALDLIVAETMILANSTWGGWLHECGVPGIYRSKASLAPGMKVRMGVKPAPHAGIGVAQYSWATSPLRRYVDLVNQWQIIACARHGRTAALAAPFKPKDAALFSIISSFDAAYAEYNAFQAAIERYWTLKAVAQDRVRELDAVVVKEGLVRAEALPLVFRAIGAEGLPRGARIRVRVDGTDLLTLDLHASLLAQIDVAAAPAGVDTAEADADDAVETAGPLTLAIDVPAESANVDASDPLETAAAG
jgi:exoribonuclease II